MKRGIAFLGMSLVVLALVSGCAGVQTASKLNDQQLTSSDTPIAHLHADNWGIYLLPIVPLLTGSTANPGWPAIFDDTVNVESVVDMTTAKSKSLGATKTTDLESKTSSVWLVPTLFFWYKSVEVSGNASK